MTMWKKLQQRRRNRLLKSLFNAVLPSDVVTYGSNGKIYVNREELSPDEIKNLAYQADNFMKSRLYDIIFGTLASKAHKTMFNKSLTFDDMVAGKMLLLALDTQKKIIKGFRRFVDRDINKPISYPGKDVV